MKHRQNINIKQNKKQIQQNQTEEINWKSAMTIDSDAFEVRRAKMQSHNQKIVAKRDRAGSI